MNKIIINILKIRCRNQEQKNEIKKSNKVYFYERKKLIYNLNLDFIDSIFLIYMKILTV